MQSTIIFPFPTLNLKYRYAVDCNNSRCNWCALLECFAVYFVMSTVDVVCIIMSCATQFFALFSRYSNSIFITLPSMPFISIHRKTNRVRFHRYTLNTSCAHSINSIFFQFRNPHVAGMNELEYWVDSQATRSTCYDVGEGSSWFGYEFKCSRFEK